jgi:hypothetical protein
MNPIPLLALAVASAVHAGDLTALRQGFEQPPADCRPRTRWWWMGNALTEADITAQLEAMKAQGIVGVEQISMGRVYERGNIEYLSPEFFRLMNHAIREARRLGMRVSLNFGGPGWIWGGDWVPPEDRNLNLVASAADIPGGQPYDGELPLETVLNPRQPEPQLQRIRPEDRVLAAVAGRWQDGRLREDSLVDLTAQVRGRRLSWQVPAGRWRLMAFWLVRGDDGPTLDHFNRAAVARYCERLGGRFHAAFGHEFGKTVDSFFGDSFEVPVFRNGLYWSGGLLDEFRKTTGYDLVRYLPAIWWDVDELSPKIRYDVNEFLHRVGIEAFFKTFVGWCERHGVQARIQPYGFPTDILEGAGLAHIPEMEITAGEKDAVPWFDTRIGPRAYTASGARLYGRPVISVEAYTYQHWEQGRETLEELKISSDIFLRAGATLFYNHGFTATPETEFAPARRFGAEMVISPVNPWWPYYRRLSDYVARASWMLRQGAPVLDVAVYSPLANQWTKDVLNARRWTRDFDWGELGALLLGNGYDFNLINDDVLQRSAVFDGQSLRVRDLDFGVLILPNIEAMPLASLRRVRDYARGGGVVIALEQTPRASTGLARWREQDEEVRALAAEMFREPHGRDGDGRHAFGRGRTYFLRQVMDRGNVLDRRSSALDPFLKVLRRHRPPDVGIDFVRYALRENPGLLFAHRRAGDADLYFVANVQDKPFDQRVAFRVTGKAPQEWNLYDGSVAPLYEYEERGGAAWLPLRLGPYASTLLVFAPAGGAPHVIESTLSPVLEVRPASVLGLARENGEHWALTSAGVRRARVEDLPAPFAMHSAWRVVWEGVRFPRRESTLSRLVSWTEDPATRNFSGTADYQTAFTLPAAYAAPDLELELDVGDVGNVADVEVNGKPAGVVWIRGQRLPLTGLVRAGTNQLRIKVTNTLINRVAGWERMPPLPPHLAGRYGRGLHDDSPGGRGQFGFEPLPRSGLLGPVRIVAAQRVELR